MVRGNIADALSGDGGALAGRHGFACEDDADGLPLGHALGPCEVRGEDLSGQDGGLEGSDVIGADGLSGAADLVVHVECGIN